MSVPNFSSLAGLEVTEKFGVGGVGWVPSEYLCLTQQSCFYSCFGLSCVELRWVLTIEVEAELGKNSSTLVFI